jgi:hypothetical protein
MLEISTEGSRSCYSWSSLVEAVSFEKAALAVDELTALVERANVAFSKKPGFIRCSVRNYMPRVLVYEFATSADAERFLTDFDLVPGLPRQIDLLNPNIVLEYR